LKYNLLDINDVKQRYNNKEIEFSPFKIGIPLIDISNKTIEEIYYFRWHTYCQQIKKTPEGHVVTEFLPPVPWAGKYNTINCPAAHHFNEGRWLHDRVYMTDYAKFWFLDPQADKRKYSFWAPTVLLYACHTWGDYSLLDELYEPLKENYAAWEESHGRENGMFYQRDGRDGMEYSISGHGIRPTINSYMCADAFALSEIAERLGKTDDKEYYFKKGLNLKRLINQNLWDNDAEFYKTLSENNGYKLADVREQIGYVPWCFNIPENEKCVAWRFLNDDNYFKAPFGPTTAERNHPEFMAEFDHECLWNGPSWPFATSQTLSAMINLLNNYNQNYINNSDYYELLSQYASCHYIEESGERKPFIDENIDPFTGEWLARKILLSIKPEREDAHRGEDYNHSTFCDLVISGLAGVSINDGILKVKPLFESKNLDYFCLDGIVYKDKTISVLWDKDGTRYEKGKGFFLYINGKQICKFESINNVNIREAL
jgi:hypothetical protein